MNCVRVKSIYAINTALRSPNASGLILLLCVLMLINDFIYRMFASDSVNIDSVKSTPSTPTLFEIYTQWECVSLCMCN